ncbi:MAG: PKD domain-containing protein [Cytophagales bacterium]|nr:MAG: PKD domain-containing protein [Cytophagales bacterium]
MNFYKTYFLFIIIVFLLSENIVKAQYNRELSSDSTEYKIDPLAFLDPEINYNYVQPYGKGIIYSANVNKDLGVIYYSESDNQDFSDLYYTEPIHDGTWKKPKPFSNSINSYLHEGAFCFDEQHTTIYYTTNTTIEKKKILNSNKPITLKIYKANLEKGKWDNFEPFIFNSEKYNVAHPALSADGKKLFFCSDMPGGVGGTDIYVCYWQNGQWGKPVNLGKPLNTKGNESFPFISSNGKLYFSSDGRKGLGKIDIYSADFINSEWKNIRNIGSPINSPFDDFAFYLDDNKLNGYFCSNRQNSVNDQIFKFQWFKSNCLAHKEVEHCFTFFEKATFPTEKQPLAYEWDLGDGTRIRGLEVEHCFAHSGDFKVQLNIIDTNTNQLFFNEATYEINVPKVNSPYIEHKGILVPSQSIDFNGSKSKLPKSKITDFVWDFGDGQKAIGIKVKHTFAKQGKYMVTLFAQGKDSLKRDVESCVYKYIYITEDGVQPIEANDDSISNSFEQVSKELFKIKPQDEVTYKVRIQQSENSIDLNPKNFKGLNNIKEHKEDSIYTYTIGESKDLETLYPLYSEVKIKGFSEAKVIAFDKNDKIIEYKDSLEKQKINFQPITHISGRIMTRYGDPIAAKLKIENLNTAQIVQQIDNIEEDGKFTIKLSNDALYGFFAERDSFYSVSNFIDLRNEKRSLEIKKNIELVAISELNEENLALRINNLFFGTKEYILDLTSFPELLRLSKIIKRNSNLKIEISGHTDNVGEEKYNLELSQKRAVSVKEFLVKDGCSPYQIIVNGYGSNKPLVSNNNERGRYINRRVEIRFLEK